MIKTSQVQFSRDTIANSVFYVIFHGAYPCDNPKYGTVMAPRIGSKGRKRPNVKDASLEAPHGTEEHRLAVKRGHYGVVIPECRGIYLYIFSLTHHFRLIMIKITDEPKI